jgi:hypothetical protein
MQLLPT